MKKWSTFFFILGIICILLSVLSVLSFNLGAIIGLLLAAVSFFFAQSLCDRITEILENQKKIIIMVDNLR